MTNFSDKKRNDDKSSIIWGVPLFSGQRERKARATVVPFGCYFEWYRLTYSLGLKMPDYQNNMGLGSAYVGSKRVR